MIKELQGIEIKTDRAYETIRNLEVEVHRFLEGKPYTITEQQQLGVEKDSLNIIDPPGPVVPPPLRFSVLAGEVLFHLRSSLDHLVWQLIIANGKDPAELQPKPEFPVYWRRKAYESRGKRKIEGVSDKAAALIEQFQPYPRNGDIPDFKPVTHPLYIIHTLNITDKHRLLNALCSHIKASLYHGTKAAHGIFRVEGRTALVLKSYSDNNEVQMDVHPEFHISFDEDGVLQTESIVPALKNLTGYVEGVIHSFNSEFHNP